MRVTRALTAVSALIAAPLLCSAQAAPADDALSIRCAAAIDVVAELTKEKGRLPLVFSDSDEMMLGGLPATPWRKVGAKGETIQPLPALLSRFDKMGSRPSAVKQCATVRAYLDQRKIAYAKAAVKRAVGNGRKSDREYTARIVGLSLPEVSEDGNDAIVIFSSVLAPLDGIGYALYLRRGADGHWANIGFSQLWIS